MPLPVCGAAPHSTHIYAVPDHLCLVGDAVMATCSVIRAQATYGRAKELLAKQARCSRICRACRPASPNEDSTAFCGEANRVEYIRHFDPLLADRVLQRIEMRRLRHDQIDHPAPFQPGARHNVEAFAAPPRGEPVGLGHRRMIASSGARAITSTRRLRILAQT
jgi:hypothetical protein